MEQGFKDKAERYKEKAKIFLKENIKTFISDINGDYFFCDIIEVSDNFLVVKGFAGKRNGEIDRLFFIDILRFEEYEEKKEVGE